MTRRHALLGGGAILASAALPPGSRALPAKWGRIANHRSPFRGERTINHGQHAEERFFIDPTPLPGYGSHAGPDPVALRGVESLLGINPYNITSQGPGPRKPPHEITDAERTAYATDIMTLWADSGLPCIVPVLHGYDARFVFPPPLTMPYEFHDLWMEHQLRLAERFAVDGLSVDPWNGWTEGCAIPPSEQDGDRYTDWWRRVVTHVRRGWAGTGG